MALKRRHLRCECTDIMALKLHHLRCACSATTALKSHHIHCGCDTILALKRRYLGCKFAAVYWSTANLSYGGRHFAVSANTLFVVRPHI
jgi:hypothetical protein